MQQAVRRKKHADAEAEEAAAQEEPAVEPDMEEENEVRLRLASSDQ